MNKIAVKKKIKDLEAEISLLKTAISERPDFEIDEINWKKMRPTVKKIRKKLFKKFYG
jgi:hypothetical protein